MSRNEILVHPRVEEASGGRHGSSSPTLYLSDTRTKEYMLARDGAPAKSGLNHIVLDTMILDTWTGLSSTSGLNSNRRPILHADRLV